MTRLHEVQMICACGSMVRSKRLPPGVLMERISPASGQEIEIAVDRTAADFVILRAHDVVDFVGGGMVIALAHGVKNQLSLLGIPSLHRHAPRLFSINGRR